MQRHSNHCQLGLEVKCFDEKFDGVKITEDIQIQVLKTRHIESMRKSNFEGSRITICVHMRIDF